VCILLRLFLSMLRRSAAAALRLRLGAGAAPSAALQCAWRGEALCFPPFGTEAALRPPARAAGHREGGNTWFENHNLSVAELHGELFRRWESSPTPGRLRRLRFGGLRAGAFLTRARPRRPAPCGTP
jgi:hypothetical protein